MCMQCKRVHMAPLHDQIQPCSLLSLKSLGDLCTMQPAQPPLVCGVACGTFKSCMFRDWNKLQARARGLYLYKDMLPCLAGRAIVRNTIISDNGLDGILLRDGASLIAENVHAMHNARHGYNLSGGSGSFKSCLSSLNGKGAVEIGNDFDSATSRTQIFTKAKRHPV